MASMIADRPQAGSPSATPERQPTAGGRSRWLRWGLTLSVGGLAIGAVLYDTLASGAGPLYLFQRFQTFVTIFLGIFIEAVPFLLAGSIVSGLIAHAHSVVQLMMAMGQGEIGAFRAYADV